MSTTLEKTAATIDKKELEQKVKDMYREVALNPKGDFHFEMGRGLAERLGYKSVDLDRIPIESIESFAGVAVVDLITVAIIIILCFIAGLISKTAFASKIIQRIESNILKKIPFYSFVKSITESISGISSRESLKPVLLEWK